MARCVAGVLLLSSCAAYQSQRLDKGIALPHAVPHIAVDRSAMPTPELARHAFDPSDGLDMTTFRYLAGRNDGVVVNQLQ